MIFFISEYVRIYNGAELLSSPKIRLGKRTIYL